MSDLGLPERFWRMVEITPACWVWRRPMEDGYGRIQIGWIRKRAHVWTWEAAHGPKPHGKVLDHLCRNRACVNPSHLRPVTVWENTFAPGSVATGKVNAEKTHCPAGHAYDEANTRISKKGWRHCRACHNEMCRRRYAEARGQLALVEVTA